MSDENPQDLMRLVQEGDEAAFREIVRRFREPVISFATRLLNDQEKAMDVAQETFINVFTHAASYRPMAGFTAWLYRIAYNLSITEIRRRGRHRALSLDTGTGAKRADGAPLRGIDPADPGSTVEQSLLDEERREAVRRCVASLPPRYRAAIVMKDMEGMTFEEIGSVLGCPESTVKSRVMRGRDMLRRRLIGYLEPVTTPIGRTARLRPLPGRSAR